jgi:hypothetical protein
MNHTPSVLPFLVPFAWVLGSRLVRFGWVHLSNRESSGYKVACDTRFCSVQDG